MKEKSFNHCRGLDLRPQGFTHCGLSSVQSQDCPKKKSGNLNCYAVLNYISFFLDL